MAELPELRISISIDMFYSYGSNIVASTNKNPYVKLPYGEFSDIRNFIWKTILKTSSKFKLLSFKPSDKGEPDRTLLKPIFLIKDSDPELYERKIDEYLLTQPTSQSFYMVANALNLDKNPISKWIIDCRVSNHMDSAKSRSAETAKKSYDYFDTKFNGGTSDSIIIPSRIKVSYRTIQNYQSNITEYKLDLSEVTNCTTIHTSISDVKTEIKDYFNHLWDICNGNAIVDVPVIHNSINSASQLDATDYTDDISNILLDIENTLISDSIHLDEFCGYTWECIHADVEDSEIIAIYVRDNFGEDFVTYTDIDIEYYFMNSNYRDEILHDIAISIFEGYDVW